MGGVFFMRHSGESRNPFWCCARDRVGGASRRSPASRLLPGSRLRERACSRPLREDTWKRRAFARRLLCASFRRKPESILMLRPGSSRRRFAPVACRLLPGPRLRERACLRPYARTH